MTTKRNELRLEFDTVSRSPAMASWCPLLRSRSDGRDRKYRERARVAKIDKLSRIGEEIYDDSGHQRLGPWDGNVFGVSVCFARQVAVGRHHV